MSEAENNVGRFRESRGLSAAGLAEMIGVSRQTIYAVESGSFVPNTAVALRLARALEVTVEELFTLPDDGLVLESPSEEAMLLAGSGTLKSGQTVQLCRVDERLVACAPSLEPWYFPASDGVVAGKTGARGKTRVRIFRTHGKPRSDFRDRILVGGCDPGISVLARHVKAEGIELILAHRNSSQSLNLLREGKLHVAGTHLRDEASGESNLPQIGKMFPKNSVAVISFAVWEEGILTAHANPKSIRSVEDFARPDVRMCNREPGAGSRALLDSRLAKLGIDARKVQGYGETAEGHLSVALKVLKGYADCCIATRAAARAFGLEFVPLVTERYDFVIRRDHLTKPGVGVLLDTLNRGSFRRELESLGGYDAKRAGDRMT